MVTLKKEVVLTGQGLMKNKSCQVTLKPSDRGEIRYIIKNREPFVASVDNVVSTDHCVTMGRDKSRAMLTEHLMAALAFCQVNSVDIIMSEDEVPILDGSSKDWVDAIKSVGIDKPFFSKDNYYTIKEPVYYLNGKTSLIILPSDNLFMSYAVNYKHADLTQKFVNYNPRNKYEIIEARTFGFYHDLKKFQMLGFAQGVTQENTVGLTDDNSYTTKLRSDLEPIKHKMLDLIGDLYLTGVNPLYLRCQILAKEAGHAVHVKVAKMLKDKLVEIV